MARGQCIRITRYSEVGPLDASSFTCPKSPATGILSSRAHSRRFGSWPIFPISGLPVIQVQCAFRATLALSVHRTLIRSQHKPRREALATPEPYRMTRTSALCSDLPHIRYTNVSVYRQKQFS
jgi:hypothetical protein